VPVESAHAAGKFSSRASVPKIALGVVRLEVIATNGEMIPVNVMFDEGSDATLVREGLIRRLGTKGRPRSLDIRGVGGVQTQVMKSYQVEIPVRTHLGEIITLTGSTMPMVTKSVPIIDWTTIKTRWEHLADLPLQPSGGQVDVLLGLDHGELMAVLESRYGDHGQPFASRTKLGWIVRGVVGADIKPGKVRASTARDRGRSWPPPYNVCSIQSLLARNSKVTAFLQRTN